MAEPVLRSEQEVLARFHELRQSVSTLFAKLNDIETEAAEHDLVLKQLEPMDKSRRCYRMIGDVLVERTVAETLPAVQRNREGLGNVVKQLQAQLEAQQKALAAFQQQYKIRVGQPGEGGSDDGGPGGKPAGSKPSSSGTAGKGAAGVLC
ncbi:Prefoldin subunit-domain-containing protein [Scenedesmus sp. NREL 46B-D3]|nr:Prefoldin subunit-domain-containing protein [Scenedesmus sp. NREL 46B-D3]